MNDLMIRSNKLQAKEQCLSFVRQVIPNANFESRDWDSIEKLLSLATCPSGREEPHMWLRSMSSQALDQLYCKLESFQKHQTFQMVSQFFLIEWCYRNEYLDSDWKWVWDTNRDGHVKYKSKFSLDSLFSYNNLC